MQDLLIIGAGAAGLSASLFASRYGLSHQIFGEVPGGQLIDAHIVENYLGITSLTGAELTERFVDHVESYGVKIDTRRVVQLSQEGNDFVVGLEDGTSVVSKSVLLAMGAKHRVLNVPGEDHFLGKGISYSPVLDAPLYAGKTVAVVGGGDSACTGALKLSEYAAKVYLIVRRDDFRAEPAHVARVQDNAKIQVLVKNVVMGVEGQDRVERINLANPVDGKASLDISGLFITIGQIPAVDLVQPLGVELDRDNYIMVGPDTATNIPGIFAAGDLALQPGGLPFRQIITSAGEGARAAAAIYQYLKGKAPAPSWST